MIQLDTGVKVPLGTQFPSMTLELSGEADFQDEDVSTANWVSQTIAGSSFGLEAKLDFEALFSDCHFEHDAPRDVGVADSDMPEEGENQAAYMQLMMPASPASSVSSDSGCNKSSNPVPRHKRASHKRAELKRRDKIKGRLDDLKAEIPPLADKGKMSETSVLSKAAEYAMHLKGECERFKMDAANLRQEIKSLSSEIHTFQEHLPASGLSQQLVEDRSEVMDQSYKRHVADRIKDNWRFYLFTFMMNPMFGSFKDDVKTDNTDAFLESVMKWAQEKMSLTTLRHQSLEVLRTMSRETSMLTSPEKLPREALASIGLQSPPVSSKVPAVQVPVASPRLAASVTSSSNPMLVTKMPLPPVTKYPSLVGLQKIPVSRAINAGNRQSHQQAHYQNISVNPTASVTLVKPVLSSFSVEKELMAFRGAHRPASTAAMPPLAGAAKCRQVLSLLSNPEPAHTHSLPILPQPDPVQITQQPAAVPASSTIAHPEPALGSHLAGHSTPATSSMLMVDLTGHEYDFDVTDIPIFPDVSDSNSNPFPLQLEPVQRAPFSSLSPNALPSVSGLVVPKMVAKSMESTNLKQEPTAIGPCRSGSHGFSAPNNWSQ